MAEFEEHQAESSRERLKEPRRMGALPQDELRKIAAYQKGILCCILANILLLGLYFALPPDVRLFLTLAGVVVAITATVFIFLLATKLYGTGLGILLGILELIPIVGLIVLLIVNGKATAVLQRHRIRVGLLGAKMSDITDAPPEHPQRPLHERRMKGNTP